MLPSEQVEANRLIDELLQSAAVNVCNGSKCYMSHELASAYQNPTGVMKLRAAKEIQIDVCREVLKPQQVFPIQGVGGHLPLQGLRKLRVASRNKRASGKALRGVRPRCAISTRQLLRRIRGRADCSEACSAKRRSGRENRCGQEWGQVPCQRPSR